MPTRTFEDLPEEKRRRVLDAAIAEFGRYGYDRSSTQRIVEAAGIARGSFYQYFKDKADLYKTLIVEVAEWKVSFLQPVIDRKEELGLFELIRELVRHSLEFVNTVPGLEALGRDLAAATSPEKKQIIEDVHAGRLGRRYRELLTINETLYDAAIGNSIRHGEISPDYDPEVIRFAVRTLVESMGRLMNSRNDGEAIDTRGRYIMDQVLAILRNGLGGPAGATDRPTSTGGSEGNG